MRTLRVIRLFASSSDLSTVAQPQNRPSVSEMAEMAQRAIFVVKLLEDLRRLAELEASHLPEAKYEDANRPMHLDAQGSIRIPKRPWEDIEEEDLSSLATAQGYSQSQVAQIISPSTKLANYEHTEQPTSFISSVNAKRQTVAEKDMAIIRSKRATNAGALNAGQPKGKYRKRSVSNPLTKHASHVRPPINIVVSFIAFMIILFICICIPAVHTASDTARKMPLVHDPRDAGVEAGARWGADVMQRVWSP